MRVRNNYSTQKECSRPVFSTKWIIGRRAFSRSPVAVEERAYYDKAQKRTVWRLSKALPFRRLSNAPCFYGTPEFSVPVLSDYWLPDNDVAAVYTRAPSAHGAARSKLSPVHQFAQLNGIEVRTPKNLKKTMWLRRFLPSIWICYRRAYG